MRLPRSQELIHWLELGGGARLIRWLATLTGIAVLSILVAWKQFHGPGTEPTLVLADEGRQLANGGGFTTHVNYPQTAAYLSARGVPFSQESLYPELHQAPLYAIVIGAGLKAVQWLPGHLYEGLFTKLPVPPNGFGADYFLLIVNVLFLWVCALFLWLIARRLFDPDLAWLPALASLLTVGLWQQTVAVNGTALMAALSAAVFYAWCRADTTESGTERLVTLFLVGLGSGLLFLTEYSAGALVLVGLGYAWVRLAGRTRLWALLAITAGFVLVSAPWVVRNLSLTGTPVGLAVENLALKAGDSTAEPATLRATYSAELPHIDLAKLGNKVLSTLQEDIRSRLWSGGAMWFAAFFVASWLYSFRSEAVNRLRWVLVAALGVLFLSQATFNSGESERWVAIWLSPLIMVFGAGFFSVLVRSHGTLGHWPRLCAVVLLAIQALPLVHDALQPRKIHFQYPPYFPALFRSATERLVRLDPSGRFAMMADVPAGTAWYGSGRVWAQPAKLHDFDAVESEQAIGELILTPVTLDRPFFSDLKARAQLPGTLSPMITRGEWGEIYAGLLTNVMPARFPLSLVVPVSDNLYVLVNPALPNSK